MTLTIHMQSFHPVKALASLSCQQELLPDHTSVAAHLMTSYQRERERDRTI